MNIFHSIILGIVEGVSEFLPISSTGHLILTAKILGFAQSDFLKSFEIIIQFGAILSVVVLYWRKFLTNFETLKRIFVAFLPTAVIGLALYKIIKNVFLGSNTIVLWSFFLGGIFLIVFEIWHKEKPNAHEELAEIPYKKAFVIGLFQAIAIIPGVSRSAATIIGGLILGLKRKTIVEFSFLLAVPTMLAASVLDLFKSADQFSLSQISVLIVGFAVSFFVALASIKFLLAYIKAHTFIPFGVYRIIVASAFWIFIIK